MKFKAKAKLFGITSLLIVSVMVMGMFPATTLADSQEPQRVSSLTEADLIATAQPLLDAQSKFYNIVNEQVSNIERTAQADGTTDTTFDLTLFMLLKAKSVSDLPFVKGMLQQVDAATVDEGTATEIAKKIAQDPSIAAFANAAGAQSSKVQSAGIPQIMAGVIATTIDTYKEYIGNTSEFCYNIKVTTDSNGKVVSVGTLAFDNYVPLEVFFPQSESAMMKSGANEFKTNVLNALTQTSSLTVFPKTIISPAYKRLSARDYANRWTSTVTRSPYIDESKYNPAYTSQNPNGGDCANYISQAMHEGGGVAEDSTWQPYTSAWNYVPSMRTYFRTTKAYWNTSTNASCAAGGVLILCTSGGSAYHVVMCVLNDTVNKAFSGHNKDRKQMAYTSSDSSITGNSSDYVEYYVFNNVVNQ